MTPKELVQTWLRDTVWPSGYSPSFHITGELEKLVEQAIAAEREASLDAIELHVDRLFGTWSATPDDVLEYIRARK